MTLPAEAIVDARRWIVQESEGAIVFREADGICGCAERFVFTRDDSGAWHVEIVSTLREEQRATAHIGTLLACYRIVEHEYGGPFGGTVAPDGRARGPFGTKATGWDGRKLPSEQDSAAERCSREAPLTDTPPRP